MNRPLIITIGIVILLAVIGLWVYLLAYGAPQAPREVFTNLGLFNGQIEEAVTLPAEEHEGVALALSNEPLQQISTRAVAGFGFSSSPQGDKVRYAELGTGHIYEIDTVNATELQITLTTFPQTAEAYFSPNAGNAVLVTYENGKRQVFAGKVQSEFAELPESAENIAFASEDTLYFTVNTGGATVAYARDLETGIQTKLFTITIPDLKLHWGYKHEEIYASTKPTQHLEGYLYRVNNGALTPVVPAAFGLHAFMNDEYIVASAIENGSFHTTSYSDAGVSQQPFLMLEEKCAFTAPQASGVWCASSAAQPDANFLEDWYKGALTSADNMWYTDLDSQNAELAADFTKLSGKTIDATDLLLNYAGSLLLFRSKVDNSLWLYRTL